MQYLVEEKDLINFTYNNINSRDYNIIVTKVNNLSSPERAIDLQEVKGRNGAIVIDHGNYKNFILTIECAIDGKRNDKDIKSIASNIKTWLQTSSNYSPLTLSESPDVEYEAILTNKIDIDEVLEELGTVELIFNCKPLRKLKENNLITITKSGTVVNNAYFKSNPLIKMYGSSSAILKINNQSIQIKKIDEFICIDSEEMECYKPKGDIVEYMNDRMIGQFPLLEAGDNNIAWIGGVTKVEIIPNWVML